MDTQIIIGTANKAKIQQIQGALKPLDISVIGLPEGVALNIQENGKTVQENAKQKAVAYARFLGRNVLSMDNALYLDGLSGELQPGVNVRRIQGRTDRPSDEDLLAYYSQLVEKLGGKINGRWEFAVCIVKPSGENHETTIISPRIFVSKVSSQVIAGYPLESIQIDPQTGNYISEMTQDDQDGFWQRAIGRQLCEFVKQALNILKV